MHLYLFEAVEEEKGGANFGDDETHSMVIRAETSTQARKIAVEETAFEYEFEVDGFNPWADPAKTSCIVLHAVGVAGVIIRDFRAG